MPQQVWKKTAIIPQCFPRIASQSAIVARGFPPKDVMCVARTAHSPFFFSKFDQPHWNPYKYYFQTLCGDVFRNSSLPGITQPANHSAFTAWNYQFDHRYNHNTITIRQLFLQQLCCNCAVLFLLVNGALGLWQVSFTNFLKILVMAMLRSVAACWQLINS